MTKSLFKESVVFHAFIIMEYTPTRPPHNQDIEVETISHNVLFFQHSQAYL